MLFVLFFFIFIYVLISQILMPIAYKRDWVQFYYMFSEILHNSMWLKIYNCKNYLPPKISIAIIGGEKTDELSQRVVDRIIEMESMDLYKSFMSKYKVLYDILYNNNKPSDDFLFEIIKYGIIERLPSKLSKLILLLNNHSYFEKLIHFAMSDYTKYTGYASHVFLSETFYGLLSHKNNNDKLSIFYECTLDYENISIKCEDDVLLLFIGKNTDKYIDVDSKLNYLLEKHLLTNRSLKGLNYNHLL